LHGTSRQLFPLLEEPLDLSLVVLDAICGGLGINLSDNWTKRQIATYIFNLVAVVVRYYYLSIGKENAVPGSGSGNEVVAEV
jgi:hypothetical protein